MLHNNNPVKTFYLHGLFWIALLVLAGTGAIVLMELIGISLPRATLVVVVLPAILVCVPAILVGKTLTSSFTEKEVRKSGMRLVLRGCPPWVEKTLTTFSLLAILSFLVVFVMPRGRRDQVIQRAVFETYAMIFSAYAAAVAYSALHTDNSPRFCSNGHEIAATHAFCPVCGSPAISSPAK
jgi:hypothetical protein